LPKAIAEGASEEFDSGDVQKAFLASYGKARDSVEDDEADNIAYQDGVMKVRKTEKEMADDRIKAAYRDLHDTKIADEQKVHDTKMNRRAQIEDAVNKVKNAKQDYIAHRIKQKQTLYAAKLGKAMGAIEGKTEASRAWADWKAEIAAEDKADAAAAAKAAKEQAKKDKRAATERGLARAAELDEDRASAAERMAEAKKDFANARAAIAQEQIEGPMGLRNLVDSIGADREVGILKYMTDKLHTKATDAEAGSSKSKKDKKKDKKAKKDKKKAKKAKKDKKKDKKKF
jgi:hypothetical protein